MRRQRGLVLVLVIDEVQMGSDTETLARVCHDFDVANLRELEDEVREATDQAIRQLRLRSAFGEVIRRAVAQGAR